MQWINIQVKLHSTGM